MDLAELRARNERQPFDVGDVAADPIEQFRRWYDEVTAAGHHEPGAMVLCTVDSSGRPSGRAVLLRGLDEGGFVFYTNRTSAKARAVEARGVAALVFEWAEVRWQVRVEGVVERVGDDENDAYFACRPRGAQLGAWASDQSEVLASRAELDARLAEAGKRFEGQIVPRPPQWGGYRVVPDVMEFWLGRPDRLHDRLRYRRSGSGWLTERLAP